MQAADGISLDAQDAAIRGYCEQEGVNLATIIQDAGESAASLNRTGVRELMRMVSANEVQAIIIYKLDRLFRNASDALYISDELRKRDVALISITEHIETITPQGKFFFTLIAAFAEMERDLIAERTREAMAFARSQGRRISSVPFGFDLAEGNRLIPNPFEQQVVTEVLQRRSAGDTLTGIASDLTKRGVRTKEGRTKWYPASVQRVLTAAERYGIQVC